VPRMRRTLLSIAAATAVVAPLAACGGSDDAAGGCTPSSDQVTVQANDDLSFDAKSYAADAGCLEITYENTGSVAHTLVIDGQSGFKLAIGDTDKGSVELSAGTYTVFCDIAGHRSAGMEADLVVS
jgi:plastocyanin